MSVHRLTYLDVLKAIAVIAVVLYHFGLLPYGYLGVDVFLVVGGFLVTRSLQKRSEGGRGWYPVFLIDRLLRLLPVLLVAGIAAMAAGWFTMLPDDYENLSESVVADDVEISYIDSRACNIADARFRDRFANADKVFVATRGLSRSFVSAVEVECWAAGLSPDKVMVVGDKSFGEHNGHVYAKRHRPDYFEQTVEPLGGEAFLDLNRRFRDYYGERFIDMMGLVTSEDGRVRVFTPDGHFISPDGKHLTRAGARWFGERIEWEKWLRNI